MTRPGDPTYIPTGMEQVPVSPLTGIPGWLSTAEEKCLFDLAHDVPRQGVIVEIGSEYGRSCAAMLAGASYRDIRMVSVDLFPNDHPLVGNLLETFQCNVETALAALRLPACSVEIMRGDSAKAGEDWPLGVAINLLFIDGDHTYEGVKHDIAAWVRWLCPNGVVAFHDCARDENDHYLRFEVDRAVSEWYDLARRAFVELPRADTMRIFRRL